MTKKLRFAMYIITAIVIIGAVVFISQSGYYLSWTSQGN